MVDQSWKELIWVSVERQDSKSTEVRNCRNEGFFPTGRVVSQLEGNLQGKRFRTFDVDLCFLNVSAIQAGPQPGTRREKFPPAMTYVGQFDQVLVPVAVPPVLWDRGEDVRRSPVDCGRGVLYGPNQAENFQGVTFECVGLKTHHCELPCACFPHCLTSAVFKVVATLQSS